MSIFLRVEKQNVTMFSNYLWILSAILFIACSCSTTPNVSIKTYPVTTKLNYKAALILDDGMRNYWHTVSINTPCFSKQKKRVVSKGNMSAKITLGSINETFFQEGFSQLFAKLDMYRNTDEVKNKEQYDFVLFPEIAVKTTYDKEAADKRKIPYNVDTLSGFMKFSDKRSNYFGLVSVVEYRMDIRDLRNNGKDITANGKGQIPGLTYAVYCGETTMLGDEAGSVVGNALKQAFINLLRDTEKSLLGEEKQP